MVVEAAGLFLSVFVLSRQAPNCSKSQGISMDGYLPFRFARRSPLTVDVNPLQLPEGLERHPSRPLHAQPDGFREAFDSKVFLYDGFPDAHGWVRLVGPPFLNLLPLVRKATIKALPSGKECTFKVRELDRHGQLLVRVPDGTLSLEINLDGTICHAVVSPSELDIFADRRVMLTLSRNNPLSWIKDWLRFGRDVHGADAALIYDNGSTDYSVAELAAALEELEGFHAIRIVMWPFRYGPQGLPDGRFWDSDFCQSGALEHARHRFLAAARSVQNSDVDETVVSPQGVSVFEAAENDRFGVVRYHGRWVYPADPDRGDLRHIDHSLVLEERPVRRFGVLPIDANRNPSKWTVVPHRTPQGAQWKVHRIGRWLPAYRVSRRFGFRHHRLLSNGWKYDRKGNFHGCPPSLLPDPVFAAAVTRVNWER